MIPAAKASPPSTELEAFSYSASHELRAPLQVIRAFSDAILADEVSALSDESRSYLLHIRRSAVRIDTTVCGLLAYARLAREKVRLRNVPLGPLLDEILIEYGPLIAESAAKVVVDSGLPVVYGESEVLFQAISNLVSNALKFTAPGRPPWIHISARSEDGGVRLSVEDRGIGIAPRNQKRIFELFARLNSRDAYPGTGVGLSLVRRAMEKIGGRSGVESGLGTGSRFWIEVPRARAQGGQRRPAAASNRPRTKPGGTGAGFTP